MKVLQLVESAAAGVGRHVIDLAEGLLSRGHEVHLVYSDTRSDSVFRQDLSKPALHPGLRAHRILMRRKPHVRDVLAIRGLREYLESRGPFDLVHFHSTKAGLIGRLGLVGHPVKRLYSPHMFFTMGPTKGKLVRSIGGWLEAALSKLCNGIVVVSREEYEHALELGISPAKLCLIQNGVKDRFRAVACAIVTPFGESGESVASQVLRRLRRPTDAPKISGNHAAILRRAPRS